MSGELSLPPLQHVVPKGSISKADLLECFKEQFRRPDISIEHVEVEPMVDRTLATGHEDLNRALWNAAGYESIPSVPEIVAELAGFNYRLEGILS